MVTFPPCKINLGLSVLSKRADGYHNLETCFYPVPCVDVLEVIPSNSFTFSSTGNVIPGPPEQNLCIKAYLLLKQDFDLAPVQIHLHKIIPAGAGLGGGSSDAANTLRLLNEIFGLKLAQAKLMEYAARLGSDCSFFVQDKPMIGTGRGEVLSEIELSLKEKFLILITPGVHISTGDAFAGIVPRQSTHSLRDILTQFPIEDWKHRLRNDFEDSVFKKYPAIKLIKEKLYSLGAIYSSMSGSGSAVFGIFESERDASREFPNDTYWSNFLIDD